MRLIVFALLFLLLSCTQNEKNTPNILFVITDDQSWIHTSYEGESEVKTPNFDRIANEGIYFSRAYASAPTCTASRSAILSGQHFWRLGKAGVLYGQFDSGIISYQRILAKAGYHIGFTGKGWGPGKAVGRPPVGPPYNSRLVEPGANHISKIDYAGNFSEFLDDRPDAAPFSFWYSPFEPHRPYDIQGGEKVYIDKSNINIPKFLPDNSIVRQDMANYYSEINWQDQALGLMLQELEERGLLDNTVIVATSDNGMPFPRAKSNNYEYGTRVPLAVRWGKGIKHHSQFDGIINLSDLAPTFLSIAGLSIPEEMTGRNLLPVLLQSEFNEDIFASTVTGFERHILNARIDNTTYPSRALHTKDFLYIRNFKEDRWPAGNPPHYKDIDSSSPTKSNLKKHPDFFRLATQKRPHEELYFLPKDPYQLENLAADKDHHDIKQKLGALLIAQLQASDDPVLKNPDFFVDQPYFGVPTQLKAPLVE